ncbi:hypothetical protein DFP72DRAFT_844807 [Ephemerocybe angulata]|uniref:Uncharacterized protein n=1 Tax=Ephemerocybe angulata TaxID=980116 RepID=A0A8H6I516_9AGAR|nr:hypothetical protein DFP72DRAFT_844807 [Tulosesus angulatus]
MSRGQCSSHWGQHLLAQVNSRDAEICNCITYRGIPLSSWVLHGRSDPGSRRALSKLKFANMRCSSLARLAGRIVISLENEHASRALTTVASGICKTLMLILRGGDEARMQRVALATRTEPNSLHERPVTTPRVTFIALVGRTFTRKWTAPLGNTLTIFPKSSFGIFPYTGIRMSLDCQSSSWWRKGDKMSSPRSALRCCGMRGVRASIRVRMLVVRGDGHIASIRRDSEVNVDATVFDGRELNRAQGEEGVGFAIPKGGVEEAMGYCRIKHNLFGASIILGVGGAPREGIVVVQEEILG